MGAVRGVGHYVSALLEALERRFPEDDYRVVLPRGTPVRAVPGAIASPLPGRVLFGTAALTGRPRLDRLAGGCDVAWLPAPAPAAVSRGVPVVLTVHDRSWEVRPQDLTAYERAWHRLARPRRLARRAARVLVTTEAGRADVVGAWGLDAARVRVVRLAPVHVPAGPAAPPQSPFLLFVGALEPRKAPDVLAQATRRARDRGLQARVVVVGDGRMRVPGLERAGHVDAARLSELYAGALALVVPSRLEGFGLPAVEALAHGTPVIASDLAPVRELLGDAARYVPADDAEALAAALLEAEAAPRRAQPPPVALRTWDDVARETRSVLAEAAG